MLLLWEMSDISCVDPDRGTGGQEKLHSCRISLQYWLGSPVKISKPGFSVGSIINSVLMAGR